MPQQQLLVSLSLSLVITTTRTRSKSAPMTSPNMATTTTRQKMDRMAPKLPAARSKSSMSLLSTVNVANMVAKAFTPGANSVGPKMLGLKAKPPAGIRESQSMGQLVGTRRKLKTDP